MDETLAQQVASLSRPELGNYKKQTIIRELGESGDAEAAAAIVPYLTDEDRYLRREAAAALAKVAVPSAREPLLAMLSDSDYVLRESAVRALALVGDSRDLSAVSELEQDVFSSVRNAAREAILHIQRRLDPDGQHPSEPPAAPTMDPVVEIVLPRQAAPESTVAPMVESTVWTSVLGAAAETVRDLDGQLAAERALLPDRHAAREKVLRDLSFQRADKGDDLEDAESAMAAAENRLSLLKAERAAVLMHQKKLSTKREKWWNRALSTVLFRADDEMEALAADAKRLEELVGETAAAEEAVVAAGQAFAALRAPILKLEESLAAAEQSQQDNLSAIGRLNGRLQEAVLTALLDDEAGDERGRAFVGLARDPHLAKLALDDLRLARAERLRIDAELEIVTGRVATLRQESVVALSDLGQAVAEAFELAVSTRKTKAHLSGRVRFSGGTSGSASGSGTGTATYDVIEPKWQADTAFDTAAETSANAWISAGAAVADQQRLMLRRTGCSRSIAEFAEYLLAEMRSSQT